MTPDQIKKACIKIAGHGGHGYLKEAAYRLKVSDRTIRDAIKPGAGRSPKLEAAIVRVIDKVQTVHADALKYDAGTWAVAAPGDRASNKAVISEAIVTHIATPVMIAHYVQYYGKDDNGAALYDLKVKWAEEPTTEKVRNNLIRMAKDKAREFVSELHRTTSDAQFRERKIKSLRKRGEFDPRDAHMLSACTLRYNEITYDDVAYQDAVRAMRDECGEIGAIRSGGWETDAAREDFSRNEVRAYELGRRYGELQTAIRVVEHIEAEDVSEEARVAVATLPTYLAPAHHTSVRGGSSQQRGLAGHETPFPMRGDTRAEIAESYKDDRLKDPSWAADYDEAFPPRS